MSDRSFDSNGEQDDSKTGLRKHVDRRSVLRKSAFTTAAIAGLPSVQTVAASDYAETLYGGNIDSFGSYDNAEIGDDCANVELAQGSAIDGNSATYPDDPAPVMCNWSAQVAESYGRTIIDNLEMTVSIENTGDGWNISDAHESLEKAPDDEGFEPSFGVSVGLFVYEFGLEFSQSGTKDKIAFDSHSVSYNFGEVCDTNDSVWENTGWLLVHLNNPYLDDECINCEVSVDVTADVTYTAGGPGPCGLNASGETATLNTHNTFQVEFDDPDC